MKKTLIFIAIILSLQSYGQETSIPDPVFPRTVIKIHPVPLYGNIAELEVESFNRRRSKSLQATAGLRFADGRTFKNAREMTLEVAYRKYISPMKYYDGLIAPYYQGLYYSFFMAGSHFEGSNLSFSQIVSDETKRSLSSGFTIGVQQTLFKMISLDVDIGGGFQVRELTYSNQLPYYAYRVEPPYSVNQRFFLKAELRLGVAL